MRDLDAAVEYRLTLLSASAGWGKTTLLSIWATRHPHQVAWVSLDQLDNDPTRFWVAVIEAARTCLRPVGETSLTILHSPEPPPLSATLTVLLNELDSVVKPTMPILLILDDYHVIEE